MCAWKRPGLTRAVARHYQRLQRITQRLDPVAVVSEGERYEGFHHIDFPNEPLGAKWNAGMEAFKDRDVDGVVIIGSDDFLNLAYFGDLWVRGDTLDYAEFLSAFFYEPSSMRAAFVPKARVGAGRYFSRRILEKMKWRPWRDDRTEGLDEDTYRWTARLPFERIAQYSGMYGPKILDVKTKDSMWSFDYWTESPRSVPLTIDGLASHFGAWVRDIPTGEGAEEWSSGRSKFRRLIDRIL